MDDIPFCGNVWPDHLIDLILKRRHPEPGPFPEPWKVQVTDALLVALNLYHTAPYLTDPKAGKELQRIALDQLKEATAQFEQNALKELGQ